MKISLSILLVLVFFLSGCAAFYYPESLRGCVVNGVYTTKVGTGWPPCGKFSIIVPQAFNKFEVHFNATKETYGRTFTYISFGPVATDETVYRVMVIRKGDMSLEEMKCAYFPLLVDLSARGYNRHMLKIYEDNEPICEKPALYEVYVQEIPGYYTYYNRHNDGTITLTHAILYVDYDQFGVIFWIQASSDSAIHAVDRENRHELIERMWKPELLFLRSFVFI